MSYLLYPLLSLVLREEGDGGVAGKWRQRWDAAEEMHVAEPAYSLVELLAVRVVDLLSERRC